jgi:hypothetical protein
MQERELSAVRDGGVVRISVPATVAIDLGRFQDALRRVADQLGHPRCFTGCDLFYLHTIRDLEITPDLEVFPLGWRSGGRRVPQDPIPYVPQDPIPCLVALAEEINSDIDRLVEAVGLAADRLGHPECHSGFDVLYQRQLDLIAIDRDMNVQGFGRFG